MEKGIRLASKIKKEAESEGEEENAQRAGDIK
jgi:hypothetical protein